MRGAAVVFSILLLFAPPLAAETVLLEGEIVDPAAYLKSGAHGPDQEELTYEAVDGGQTLALLDTTGKLYLLLAEQPGEDPNELAYDYVNRNVKVAGAVFERSGLRGIIIGSIAPTEAAEPSAGVSPTASLPLD